MTRYDESKAIYAKYGIDTEKAIETLREIPISIHCWQADDICGFENKVELSGGIQVTGNHFGKARNAFELMSDLEFALSHMAGEKRINLHAIYAISEEKIERDNVKTEYFDKWLEFGKKNNVKFDFNPTFFSHKMVVNGMTLSSPIDEVRKFWIRHGQTCRDVAKYIGEKQGSPCLFNVWIPDGLKDVPSDRLTPRMRLKDSLDKIFVDKSPYVIDAVESKVFGIGVESYTVGSNEFYMQYANYKGICCLLDNGHYHPTENVSDKIPSLLAFNEYVALHVTRAVRWDSDHVVLFEDEIKEIAKEIVRNDATKRVLIGLDYFDASINRISAYVVGEQSMRKALLFALLQPNAFLKKLQDDGDGTKLMYLSEIIKTLPFGDIWEEFNSRNGVKTDCYDEIEKYENEILKKRV